MHMTPNIKSKKVKGVSPKIVAAASQPNNLILDSNYTKVGKVQNIAVEDPRGRGNHVRRSADLAAKNGHSGRTDGAHGNKNGGSNHIRPLAYHQSRKS